MRVIYADPDRVYNDGVATAQDLAHINAQGGRRRSAEFRFPGISNPRLAAYVATRELNFLARPIMKLRVAVNRVDVGHDGGTDVAAGSIARIRLRAREPRL